MSTYRSGRPCSRTSRSYGSSLTPHVYFLFSNLIGKHSCRIPSRGRTACIATIFLFEKFRPVSYPKTHYRIFTVMRVPYVAITGLKFEVPTVPRSCPRRLDQRKPTQPIPVLCKARDDYVYFPSLLLGSSGKIFQTSKRGSKGCHGQLQQKANSLASGMTTKANRHRRRRRRHRCRDHEQKRRW